MWKLCHNIALFCLILLINLLICQSFNVYIPPQTEKCFNERAFINEKVLITFNVQQGGYQEIDVSVRDAQEKLIYSQGREEKGNFIISNLRIESFITEHL